MKTMILTKEQCNVEPCVATIGFFDGVHRGHRHLIRQVVEAAKGEGKMSMVITFDRHPRQFLHPDTMPQMLNTPDERERLLAEEGVDICVILPFNNEIAALSAREFMSDVLVGRLNVRHLIIGYDHRFGRNRADGFEDYVRYGTELGMEVSQSDAFSLDAEGVSSSVIRRMISEGNVEGASLRLGYCYSITGKVVGGYQNGRKIGFPTANIKVEDSTKIIPQAGVYAVKVRSEAMQGVMSGMMNIGKRPTFGGESTSLEINIFGFDGDLYGSVLSVMFVRKMRDERRFGTEAELIEQLTRDREEAERILDDC